ncbi:hypothetical protein AURANDRAFT_11830, partial [Aureococcus anophagefferens]
GSSDPRARFQITGTKRLKCKSKTIKKSLDPSWRETFSLELPEGEYMEGETKIDFGANGPILEVTIEDVDELTSADFMGELNIPLEPLKKQRTRAWHPLQADAEGKHKSSNVCGELRLALVQGRGLAIKDKNLLSKGGSSDPFVKFEVTGGDYAAKPFKSSIKKKTLQPVWREIFQVPLKQDAEQDNPVVDVTVYDHDEVSSPDFMGR